MRVKEENSINIANARLCTIYEHKLCSTSTVANFCGTQLVEHNFFWKVPNSNTI